MQCGLSLSKLLVHILESNFDLKNPSDHVPFTVLHDSLVLVKDELSQSKTNERHIYPNFGCICPADLKLIGISRLFLHYLLLFIEIG